MRLNLLRRVWGDESGATAVDYAMLVCAIALVIVALAGSGLSPTNVYARVGLIAAALDGNHTVEVPARAAADR